MGVAGVVSDICPGCCCCSCPLFSSCWSPMWSCSLLRVSTPVAIESGPVPRPCKTPSWVDRVLVRLAPVHVRSALGGGGHERLRWPSSVRLLTPGGSLRPRGRGRRGLASGRRPGRNGVLGRARNKTALLLCSALLLPSSFPLFSSSFPSSAGSCHPKKKSVTRKHHGKTRQRHNKEHL